jgi:Arc/MetJ-type ribon-helix-helix transcriptional regulator
MKERPSRLSENLAPYLADESGGVTKLSISLPNDLVEEVRRTAKERRTSVSATIGAALRRALEEDRRRLDVAESGPPVSAVDAADLAGFRGRSLGGLVDEALGEWLASRGIRLSAVREDEWRRRLETFIEQRRRLAEERGWTAQEVQSDVDAAVKEVREARAARRR